MKKLKSMYMIDKAHRLFEFLFSDAYAREVIITTRAGNKYNYTFERRDWDALKFVVIGVSTLIGTMAIPIVGLTHNAFFMSNIGWIKLIKYIKGVM